MSVTSKASSQRRNDSGELVVFEAARYFSSGDENACNYNSSLVFPHNSATDDGGRAAAVARMSLDMPAINRHMNLSTVQVMREKKKCKQPSSPGGRLASFLNSLFNQTNSKKKKKSKTGGAAADGGEDDHYTDDRRRSSISHFGITNSTAAVFYDSNSTYSAAVTPPCRAKTPTKSSYLKSFSDRQKAVYPQRNGENVEENERFRFDVGSCRNPRAKCANDDEDEGKFGKFSDGDDEGDDSDSSSDLFDLPNLDFYSSGLPVYGTTDMGRIRIGAPIPSAAAV